MNARDWLRKKLKVRVNHASTRGGAVGAVARVVRDAAGLPTPETPDPGEAGDIVVTRPEVKRPSALNPGKPGQVSSR